MKHLQAQVVAVNIHEHCMHQIGHDLHQEHLKHTLCSMGS